MSDVVCFGEIMLRLTTPRRERLADAVSLDVCFGGAEANVAVQIAGLGGRAAFVSRLPDNDLAVRALEALRSRGVDVSGVATGGSRMGLYFIEPGSGPRPTSVLYDRAGSAMSEVQAGDFSWSGIFRGARWFHWSGITPALGPGCAAACREACEAARAAGLTVSFDVNHRAKLWSTGRAGEVLRTLMPLVDVLVCGESEAGSVLGVKAETGPEENRLPALAAALREKFEVRTVAMTRRDGDSAEVVGWRAMLATAAGAVFSREHHLVAVDRVGTGDAFTGGLIFALMRGDAPQDAIEFAAAAGAWKHTIPGDWNRASVDELNALAAGGGGARVRR